MNPKITMVAIICSTIITIGLFIFEADRKPIDKSSSFAGYSQSCWQVGDTLHVVTAKGDTVRLDVSKLEGSK